MIAVRIPKEIKEYKEKFIAGLNLRQFISTVLALSICVPLYWKGYKFINEEILSWMIIFIALPIVSFGFFKFNGMYFEKFIVVIFKQEFLYPNKRKFKSENFFKWTSENENRKKSKKTIKKEKENSISRVITLIENDNPHCEEIIYKGEKYEI